MSPAAREKVIFIGVSLAQIPLIVGEAFLFKAVLGDGPFNDWEIAGLVAVLVSSVAFNAWAWYAAGSWLIRRFAA